MINMKRVSILSVGFAALLSLTVFAGTWRSDDTGWWYDRGDGTYPSNTWEWIDGNGDGTAECYYFYPDGYMAHNNVIDGYSVNDDGKWEVNGRIQTRQVNAVPAGTAAGTGEQAVRAYRQALESNSWNSRGIAAEKFCLVDIDNDGILEMAVETFAGRDDNVGTLLYYNGSGLQKAQYGEIECLEAADKTHSRILYGRTRGKANYRVASFDRNQGIQELGSWFLGYGKQADQDLHDQYAPGMYVLNFVDNTAGNINAYLSGAGTETGFIKAFDQ